MTEYRFADLLDLTILQNMADANYNGAGMPIGIIDAIDGSILVGAGWQDICTKYHRAHALTLERCHESDSYIGDRLVKGEAMGYKCRNGLWDIATPIVVEGRHLATLFIGQFFYDGEQPDRDFFRRQARTFGFDEAGYLEALDRVPTFSRDKVEYVLEYHKALAGFIAELAEAGLREKLAEEVLLKDIAERRQAEQELRQQAEFLQSLIDAAPNPIFYKDAEGRFLGCNRAFEALYGLASSEIIGKTVHAVQVKEQAGLHAAVDAELLAHRGRQTYESPFTAPDGRQCDLQVHKATFDGPDGTPAGIIGVVVNITDRKAAEREWHKLQDQLAHSQKMESVGRLAGGVAHDFNNMLNIILGYSELMLFQVKPDDPLYSQIQEIHTAGERSRDITRQLLAFARKEIITPKVLDLNSSVEEMIKILKRLIGENITLTWLPGQNLWPVLLDPSQLDQILANLCVNARDAIADVGKVVIATGTASFDADYCAAHEDVHPGDYVWLSVSDSGCGMDDEMLDKVFEPFFTTKGLGQGTGLGLSTVYGIVKQNDGGIEVESLPGQGTAFTIYIPRHEEAVPDTTRRASEGPTMGNGETVLVVEDEVAILELTELILTTYNYRVIAAKSPTEGLSWAESHPGEIDLLVTDVVMPEMNGRDLADRLRSLYPAMKVLYMSGYTANVVADRGTLGEGVHFIQKPWTTLDFVAKVQAALSAAIAAPSLPAID
jgi:PAS domain S-box-containing protein